MPMVQTPIDAATGDGRRYIIPDRMGDNMGQWSERPPPRDAPLPLSRERLPAPAADAPPGMKIPRYPASGEFRFHAAALFGVAGGSVRQRDARFVQTV